jgi:hypothetical protein
MKSLESIIIPACDSQQWIADSLLSALTQTRPGREVIVERLSWDRFASRPQIRP